MITNKAKQKVALFLKEFFQLATVGTGGDSTNPNQNVLDVPIFQKATTNAISDDTTIDFTVSYTGSQLEGNTIREIGIFSATTPADDEFDELRTATSYGVESTLLSRISFEAIGPFANTDQIDITLTIEVE